MRTARIVAHLLAAVALATCADGPTGPRAVRDFRVGFAPAFTEQALATAALLAQGGIPLDSVHMTIVRKSNGAVLYSGGAPIAAGQQTLTLEASVTITGEQEELWAKLQYLAGGMVLFEGQQLIVAKPGTTTAGELPATAIDYVGAGSDATELFLLPADTTISTTTPLTLAVKAKDAAGNLIADPLVLWTSSEPALATVVDGVVTPVGTRGTVRVSARVPLGPQGEAVIRLVPPPAQVAVAGGSAQEALVGTTLPVPFKVRVTAQDGLGVAGVPVKFESLTAGGSVGLATTETDADGYAVTSITLGPVAGDHQFKATAGSMPPVTITVKALPLPASALSIIAQPTDTIGSGITIAQPLKVQLVDSTGKAVAKAGIPVTVSALRAGEATMPITLSGTATVSTTADGLAEFTNLALTGIEGEVVLVASALEVGEARTAVLYLDHGLVATLAVLPAPPTAPIAITAGDPITEQLWLETHDAAGNRVPNEPVRFVVLDTVTGIALLDTVIPTNGIGELPASSFPVPRAPGFLRVAMSVGTPPVAQASLRLDVAPVVLPPSTLTKIAGDAQADTIEALLPSPLVVELRDGAGAPLANATVVWRALPTVVDVEGSWPNAMLVADATVPDSLQDWWADSLTTTTDAQGRAQMHVRLGQSTAFPALVRATTADDSLSADFTFTVQAGAPYWLEVVEQPATLRAGIAATVPVRVRPLDVYDNPVKRAGIPLVLAPYYSGEGQPTLGQTALTAPSSGPRQRPAPKSAPTRTSTASTLGEVTTSGYVEPTLTADTAYTDAEGIGTFSGIVLGGAAGGYWIDVSVPDVEWLGDFWVELLPGEPSTLAVRSVDGATEALPGDSVAVEALLVDAWQNVVDTDAATRSITWSTTAGVFAPTGAMTITSTMTKGVATAVLVVPATTGTAAAVTATTPGLAGEPSSMSGTSEAITVVMPAPASMVHGALDAIAAGDRQVRMIGESLARPLLAKVLDERGQPMAGVPVIWRAISQFSYVDVDTAVTDTNGIVSLLPTLPADPNTHGYVYEAVPRDHQYLNLRFQAIARPDSSFTHAWFGTPYTSSFSADWSAGANWDAGTVPTSASNVLVPHWNGYFTAPHLTGSTVVNDYHSAAAAYAPLDLKGNVLTVMGRIEAMGIVGAGEVHLAGAATEARLGAGQAKVVVPSGAAATVIDQVQAFALDVQGSLTANAVPVMLNGGDLTIGAKGRLDLPGTGAVTAARSVLLEAGAMLVAGSGSIQFQERFEQRGTTPLVLDSTFRILGSFTDVPATISLPAGSSVGSLLLMGSAGRGSSVTIGSGVGVKGDLQAFNVTVSSDSLTVGGITQADSASSFANVGVLYSRGASGAPLFQNAPARKVIVDAGTYLYAPSRYADLELRGVLDLASFRLDVTGNLFVSGQGAAIRMDAGSDSVIVEGAAHFAGANSGQYMTQGTLIVRGDFLQLDPDQKSAGSFRPGAELEVVLAGKEQRVSFQSPSSAAGSGSYFTRVRVEAGAVATQTSNVYVTNGRLETRGTWVTDDYGAPEPARLLDVSGFSELRAEGPMELSRLNLYRDVKVDIRDTGKVNAYACWNEGATILGLPLNCRFPSDIPLVGSILGLLGGTTSVHVALGAATASRRGTE